MTYIQWLSSIEKYFYTDAEEYYEQLAVEFLENAETSIRNKGLFIAVLGGGNTPKYINSKIVELSTQYDIDWNRVHIVLSDERWIEDTDELSNYKMILETLAVPLKIKSLYNVYADGISAEEAAEKFGEYVEELWTKTGRAAFDYAMLGVGSDGHTASLFPDRQQIQNVGVNTVCGGKGPEGLERISLSYAALNKCDKVSFLVNSPEKRNVLAHMEKEWNTVKFPIQNIVVPKNMHILREEKS